MVRFFLSVLFFVDLLLSAILLSEICSPSIYCRVTRTSNVSSSIYRRHSTGYHRAIAISPVQSGEVSRSRSERDKPTELATSSTAIGVFSPLNCVVKANEVIDICPKPTKICSHWAQKQLFLWCTKNFYWIPGPKGNARYATTTTLCPFCSTHMCAGSFFCFFSTKRLWMCYTLTSLSERALR